MNCRHVRIKRSCEILPFEKEKKKKSDLINERKKKKLIT